MIVVGLGSGELGDEEVNPVTVPFDAPLRLGTSARRNRDVALCAEDPAEVGAEMSLVIHHENGLAFACGAHGSPEDVRVVW